MEKPPAATSSAYPPVTLSVSAHRAGVERWSPAQPSFIRRSSSVWYGDPRAHSFDPVRITSRSIAVMTRLERVLNMTNRSYSVTLPPACHSIGRVPAVRFSCVNPFGDRFGKGSSHMRELMRNVWSDDLGQDIAEIRSDAGGDSAYSSWHHPLGRHAGEQHIFRDSKSDWRIG